MDDIGVFTIIWGTGAHHYIAVRCGWIENILRASDIICGVVYTCNVVHVDAIVFEEDAVRVAWHFSIAVGWLAIGPRTQIC
jgi:hypothetical protein